MNSVPFMLVGLLVVFLLSGVTEAKMRKSRDGELANGKQKERKARSTDGIITEPGKLSEKWEKKKKQETKYTKEEAMGSCAKDGCGKKENKKNKKAKRNIEVVMQSGGGKSMEEVEKDPHSPEQKIKIGKKENAEKVVKSNKVKKAKQETGKLVTSQKVKEVNKMKHSVQEEMQSDEGGNAEETVKGKHVQDIAESEPLFEVGDKQIIPVVQLNETKGNKIVECAVPARKKRYILVEEESSEGAGNVETKQVKTVTEKSDKKWKEGKTKKLMVESVEGEEVVEKNNKAVCNMADKEGASKRLHSAFKTGTDRVTCPSSESANEIVDGEKDEGDTIK